MSAASCASLTSTSAIAVLVGRRHVAIGLEHARDARARDQVARKLEIERRQRQRLVVDDLDRRAAAAEHDDRAEGRIVGDAGDEFARLGPHDHRMDRHAGDARVGPCRLARARRMSAVGLAHRALRWSRLSRTPPTSDLCTMSRRQDLHDDGVALRQEAVRPRRRLRRRRARGAPARSGWHRPPAAARSRSDRATCGPPASARLDDAARRRDIGREILRQARRRRHQGFARFAIAHEMHEAGTASVSVA